MKKNVGIKLRAFTLVELLVVIAIIALLLSVLMPSLTKAREQAKAIICKAQLHDWGLAFASYGNEYKDQVCASVSMSNGIPVTWDISLKPYYLNDKIRYCPSAPWLLSKALPGGTADTYLGTKNGAWGIYPHQPKPWGVTGSYGMNVYAQFWTPTSGATWPITEAKCWGKISVPNARQIPLMGDCLWREAFVTPTDAPRMNEVIKVWNTPYNYGPINLYMIKRHQKFTNIVFLDSSVQNVSMTNLFDLWWSRDYQSLRRNTPITVYGWMK